MKHTTSMTTANQHSPEQIALREHQAQLDSAVGARRKDIINNMHKLRRTITRQRQDQRLMNTSMKKVYGAVRKEMVIDGVAVGDRQQWAEEAFRYGTAKYSDLSNTVFVQDERLRRLQSHGGAEVMDGWHPREPRISD